MGFVEAMDKQEFMRAFLRFLRWRGDFTVDLAGAVPGVAGWGHETVPHRLAPEQGQRVLDGCERTSIVGKRNYAIVLLLARLGFPVSSILKYVRPAQGLFKSQLSSCVLLDLSNSIASFMRSSFGALTD